MPTRSATVILDANIGPYTAKMTRAAAVGAATGKSIDSSMTKATTGTQKLGQATGLLPAKFGGLAAVGGAAFGGVALAAFGAVKTFAEFDVAMDAVAASTGASNAELEKLGDTAIDAARDTKFGATEAARGIEALGKAGIETADIIGGGLKGSLDLAAAGEIEVAEAAELAASAMTQFGLEGEDIPHIADLLAAGATKAQGSVSDMGDALSQSGQVAALMGLSIEETVGTLTMFAEAGLTGSDAGTSFRTMLIRLANPTGEARDLMESLGIVTYDAQGNFIGMEALAGVLQERLGGLTQEQRNATLAILFGQDAIRGSSIAYENGAEGAAAWTREITDAGFAAEQAADRTDNLMGDLERLGGEVEALGITLGGTADGPLRDFVQWLEESAAEINEEVDLWQNEYIPAAKDAGDWINEHLIPDFIGLNDVIGRNREEIALGTAATERMNEAHADNAENLAGYKAAQEGATAAQEDATDVTGDQAEAAAQLAEEMAKMTEEALEAGNAFLDTRDINREWLQSIEDATVALEENGAGLDVNTEAGRANEDALDDMGTAALRMLEDMVESGVGTDTAQRQMRRTLIDTGTRFGMTQGQAEDYADSVLAIPDTATTTATFDKSRATRELAIYRDMLAKGFATRVSIRVIESFSGTGGAGAQGGKGFTAGFPLPGGRGAYRVSQGPHDGGAIDYAAPRGTAIFASYSGELNVSDLGNRSYGKYYTLRSGNRYELGAHLQGFAHGDGHVSQGQLIGWVDSTGNSTGNHLHLLRNFAIGGMISHVPVGASVPINAHGGEYVVSAAATARNRGTLEAINSGRGGGGNVTLVNHGVIGSQIELENWLARGVDNLRRRGRLP